jgi:hypothetical protein
VTQTFGGDSLSVDKDFVDVRARSEVATSQQSPAVTLPDGDVMVFYRAGGDRLWLDRYAPRGGWAKAAATGASASSAPSAVWTGSQVAVFSKDRTGYLWVSYYRPDGKLASRRRLSMMGVLGSAPRAIAEPGGLIDVFWRGSADDHLWHGQYTQGAGWNGPQGLGGNLSSLPSPVISSAGFTAVFWKGTDSRLWLISRGLSGRWSGPRSLGMAPLGGAPQATAQPGGGIEIYWSGSGNPYLWEGFYAPRTGWRGPRDLGGRIGSTPWPVTASGTVRVLWRDPGRQLNYTSHRPGHGWNVLSWTSPARLPAGRAASAPFASVGGGGTAVHVFWRGRRGALWTAMLTSGGWSRPAKLA